MMSACRHDLVEDLGKVAFYVLVVVLVVARFAEVFCGPAGAVVNMDGSYGGFIPTE